MPGLTTSNQRSWTKTQRTCKISGALKFSYNLSAANQTIIPAPPQCCEELGLRKTKQRSHFKLNQITFLAFFSNIFLQFFYAAKRNVIVFFFFSTKKKKRSKWNNNTFGGVLEKRERYCYESAGWDSMVEKALSVKLSKSRVSTVCERVRERERDRGAGMRWPFYDNS